jgi:hypothetical protein
VSHGAFSLAFACAPDVLLHPIKITRFLSTAIALEQLNHWIGVDYDNVTTPIPSHGYRFDIATAGTFNMCTPDNSPETVGTNCSSEEPLHIIISHAHYVASVFKLCAVQTSEEALSCLLQLQTALKIRC